MAGNILRWILLPPALIAIGTCTYDMTRAKQDDIEISVPAIESPAPKFAGCVIEDFQILNWNAEAKNPCKRVDCTSVIVTGELMNNCKMPAGAELKITARSKSNAVLGSDEIWPASTRNIGAGQTYAFQVPLDPHTGTKSYEIQVIDVRTWRR